MQRIISYKGNLIIDEKLVVGNHTNTHIQIDGNFRIEGLIYCPKQILKLTLKGSGVIALHGVCREVEIRTATKNCMIDLANLKIGVLRCRLLEDGAVLRLGEVKIYNHRSRDAHAALGHGRDRFDSSSNTSIISYASSMT